MTTIYADENLTPPEQGTINIISENTSENTFENISEDNNENILNMRLEPIEKSHIHLDDGSIHLIKTYQLPNDFNNGLLPRESFMLDGRTFVFDKLSRQNTEDITKRESSERVRIETSTSDINTIMDTLRNSRFFDIDGFNGYLHLNHETITTSPQPATTQRRVVTDTRNYTNLPFADISSIARSLTRNGVTLELVDVQFTRNQSPIDHIGVAHSYNATAFYRGYHNISVIPGFVTTAYFEGTLINPNIIPEVFYDVTFISSPNADIDDSVSQYQNDNEENCSEDDLELEQTFFSQLSDTLLIVLLGTMIVSIPFAIFLAYKKGLFSKLIPKKEMIIDEKKDVKE